MMSNSDDPPGSYRSGNLFVPHPTIPDAWKFIRRNDDCITLANGEKINPMAMEGVLRQHPLVRDALMFGSDQPLPGVLVFQSHSAGAMSADEYMAAIGPALHEANMFADEFARVTPDMVVLIPPDVEYPVTDKNSIIRKATYSLFEDRILAAYSGADEERGKEKLDVPDMERHLLAQFRDLTGVSLGSVEADFFSAGVDSLGAIQIRRALQRCLDLGGASLAPNIVYDARNVSTLARWLYKLRVGEKNAVTGTSAEEDVQAMEHLIDRYGHFEPFHPQTQESLPPGDVVLLTGATGALGAHILHHLLRRPSVSHIYCIARGAADSTLTAHQRVLESLKERGIDPDEIGQEMLAKLSVLDSADLGGWHLGLPDDLYSQLRSQITLVVHAAWPVNFSIPLASFEPHVAGLHNLLQLVLSVPRTSPARLLFASSVATAYATPRDPDGTPALIPEAPIPLLAHCLRTGYAQSKLVGERICERAAAAAATAAAAGGGRIGVLRIGQIAGDTTRGIWNPREAVPLMVHSALVVGALPLLDGEHGVCEWMPVDAMAEACLQAGDVLGGPEAQSESSGAAASYYNLVAPHAYSWNEDVLPALKEAGLSFEAVPFVEWLARLQARAGDDDMDARKLPALKLLDYYQSLYGEADGQVSIARFDVSGGCRDLPALRDCPRIIERGLVGLFLKGWINI